MKTYLSIAALAVAAALLVAPATSQASQLKLDGLYQDSLVQNVAAKKKKLAKKKTKKKVAKKKMKKKVAVKHKKKRAAKA
jgi:hypothetical protein